MNLNTMTTNERERLAYAEGFVETAKLFARLDDMQRALGESVAHVDAIEQERQAYRDLVEERDELEDQLTAVERSRDELEDELDALFDDYQTMRAERDDARVAASAALDYLTNIVEGAGSPFYNQAGAADRLRELLLGVLP